ncbi:hypothetical protein LSO07_13455 [Janthinobacterium sp. PLB04]|uniref:Uncharacterized protein n=1 Tax=Janthinobacterium lividum TaxID=29581 RepID=A0AAJ4T7N1_9BURK|nr:MULTISPECIES: hypothetical protein [Janthinobacterium]KAB0324729.1 hypothetical protein F3B38_13505 [Janthinobacterium lividum]QSX98839.1 hypothetical protein J3P46_13605 [Janthinobacterium lividum]UGQ38814.1 hypothetical protein LSO07_13455 [Janthinobacterium sp. PLB04]
MRTLFLSFLLPACLMAGALCAHAQAPLGIALEVGSGPGQLGLEIHPNEECQGPAAIASAGAERIAVLDKVNGKIIVLADGGKHDVALPPDLLEPVDFLATSQGFLVVGALGEVVVVSRMGQVLARTRTDYNAEAGVPQLVALADGFALDDLNGKRTPIDLSKEQAGTPLATTLAAAASYAVAAPRASPNEILIESSQTTGPLAKIRLTSNMRIVDARVLWVNEEQGALVALHESRRLPDEAAYVRLVKVNTSGAADAEAYVQPAAFACDTRRPYVRRDDGTVLSLLFHDNTVRLQTILFSDIGKAEPLALASHLASTTLIAEYDDSLRGLERLNGVSDATNIALMPISASHILQRARAPLELVWRLKPSAFAQTAVANLCKPPENIWRRPRRLDDLLDKNVTGIPYRWGGYMSSLDSFTRHLDAGRLAGDDCTCRQANCVYPNSTGMDCSGFVSYAWNTGRYFTTGSLPDNKVSKPVTWHDLSPADIVNKPRSHVRLVESVHAGPAGPVVVVIESTANLSCGGVCRRSYTQAELQQAGYKPLRRVALSPASGDRDE